MLTLLSRTGRCANSLIAGATALMLTATSPVFANDPPKVQVNGTIRGTMSLNNPVVIKGVATDKNGISRIDASIQSITTQRFVTQQGGLSTEPAAIKVTFSKSRTSNWSTQSFRLPKDRYMFRVRAVDGSGIVSKMVEVPFLVDGGAAQATAPATRPATQQASAAPRTAIQFPKNGAKLSKAAAFTGIAQDDQTVVGVVATIMNTSTGMYLAPNGRFAKSGQLKLRTVQGKNAQWSTPQVTLPDGDYLLSVKAVDNNGQDGQWAQSSFTVATATAAVAAAPTVAAGALAANGMPYCTAGKDSDGDGFGWQNNASCVVAGSKADTHPTCASSGSDPDGDGYGWENEKSCIVVTHCASANSDPDGDGFGFENNRSCIVLQQTSGHPACASGAASDPDGDGYGWENNATCVVR